MQKYTRVHTHCHTRANTAMAMYTVHSVEQATSLASLSARNANCRTAMLGLHAATTGLSKKADTHTVSRVSAFLDHPAR